jgi:predicted 3-demethylubiquinone-9 3-methyltransferase (glyoxalase superfamily)
VRKETTMTISLRPHLWFGNQAAHRAAAFYAEHIPDSSVQHVMVAPAGIPDVEEGEPFIVDFTVGGVEVIGLNAGAAFTLDESFSFYLLVDTQDEVNHYWDLLTTDGGEESYCGWCRDRFGVSWQIIPRRLEEVCGDYTTDANRRAMEAMLKMRKIDIATLEAAYAGD